MQKPSIPRAAQPRCGAKFDAWNSSSTGHQRAENRLGGSTGWRQSRTMKLSNQFKNATGGKRISDQVGAGSENWDEKSKALIPKDIRERAHVNIRDMLVGKVQKLPPTKMSDDVLMVKRKKEDGLEEKEKQNRITGVFDGLVIYINGSTYPLISNHKLKHLLAENGGKISIHLGRKQVTHVILGNPAGSGTGAGGGLSGSKVQKEIKRVGGRGVKFVGVEWVLESMKVGKRLSEAQFSNLKVAAFSQKSVYGMFKTTERTGSEG